MPQLTTQGVFAGGSKPNTCPSPGHALTRQTQEMILAGRLTCLMSFPVLGRSSLNTGLLFDQMS
jgi:hypothetical protein